MLRITLPALLLLSGATSAQALDVSAYRLVDLTHAFNEQTIYWPTAPSRFELETLAFGETRDGYFYSAFSICTPEHGGTHLDAPIHFSAQGLANHKLPLTTLIAHGVVIDVSDKAAEDRDYRLSVDDVLAFEAEHGQIPPGGIILLRTGWSRFWPNTEAYLGDDTPGDASRLSFPSYGEAAAMLLVNERRAALLGVDTASIDYGKSTDFIVHRVAAARNVGGLENLTNLDKLPETGFTVLALPMKIQGGSGGPVRAVALVPK